MVAAVNSFVGYFQSFSARGVSPLQDGSDWIGGRVVDRVQRGKAQEKRTLIVTCVLAPVSTAYAVTGCTEGRAQISTQEMFLQHSAVFRKVVVDVDEVGIWNFWS